uniref:ATP-grasp domain-containing protein n=1 Tax=unclassified Variovorax TaxID=663243 RepID=UPI000D39D591
MHWVLQENLFKENEWANLTGALERFGIPFSVHKVVPFVGELVPPARPAQEKVVCFGSYSMRHTARAQGWTPGVYDLFDQNFQVQLGHWGERMLNFDSRVVPFKHVPLLAEPTFLRPIDDSKYFAGKVFMPEEFNGWKHKVVDLGHDHGTALSGDTLVQICRPKTLYGEYRFWVVNGEIVTRSMYKRGDKVVYASDVDERFDGFVRQCVAAWQPHRAFVIDVCDTPLGMKIVEINTVNAAGFYAGNVQSLVLALEDMEAVR